MDREDAMPLGDMAEQLTSNIMRLVERRYQEDARASLSERISERITKVAGSMTFILLHVVFYGGLLLMLTDLIPIPVPFGEGPGMIGSVASTEPIFLRPFPIVVAGRS